MQSKVKQMNISKEKLKELYDALPHGSIKQIADAAGTTTQAVRDVLKHGKYMNERILEETIKVAGPVIEKRKRLDQQLNSILNQL